MNDRNMKIWAVEKAELAAGAEEAVTAIGEAAVVLQNGGIVAFPTETVYGLGADARDTGAVERIFQAKGRPSDNPLIVHIAEMEQLEQIVLPYGEVAKRLMLRFWPGPLTIVLPAREGAVSPRVTAGLDTVAVRMPDHVTALRLIAVSGCPIAAPSANRSGRPSPTRAAHVEEDLAGRIDGLVDSGPTGVGLESTVVEITEDGEAVRILRPGGIALEALREVVPVTPDSTVESVEQAAADKSGSPAGQEASAPRSPGMKYAHYAPQGAMQLVIGEPAAVRARIQDEVDAAQRRGEKTGVLTYTEHAPYYRADVVLASGSLTRLESAAQGLYAALREFDTHGVQAIWAEACPQEGIGHALMNRLSKAAGHRFIRV
ncbi:L-threonylcarbamoyladenylate synthase [Paenibacillus abyssi]|nr:L-threonylcarbamoyladenylate synthase [Paenibacillus abyssi]